jgi:hypothetical protein
MVIYYSVYGQIKELVIEIVNAIEKVEWVKSEIWQFRKQKI